VVYWSTAIDRRMVPVRTLMLAGLGLELRSITEAKHRSAAWEQVRKDLLPVIERVRKRKGSV
jgi:hypothetical protein